MYFVQKGHVLLVTDRHNTTEEVRGRNVAQPNLLVEFHLGLMNKHGSDIFEWFLDGDEDRQTSGFKVPFKKFRQELDECTGIYTLQASQPFAHSDGETVYQQKLSQAAQVRSHHNSRIDKAHHMEHCRWQLRFQNGVWQLETRPADDDLGPRMVGTLQTEDFEDQRADKVPLGVKVMWGFDPDDVELPSEDAEVPKVPIPVSIVKLLDSLTDGSSFGELEMLRLGGGTTTRTREATARALTNSYLSTLSYDSYTKLKGMFKEEMTQNEEFFKRTARKKGINRARKVSLLQNNASTAVGDDRSSPKLSTVPEEADAHTSIGTFKDSQNRPYDVASGTSGSMQVERQQQLILKLSESIEAVQVGQSNLESMMSKLGEWAYRLENQVASAAFQHGQQAPTQSAATDLGAAIGTAGGTGPDPALVMTSSAAEENIDAEIDGWIDEALDGRLQLLGALQSSQDLATQLHSLIMSAEEANALQARLYDDAASKSLRKAWNYAVNRSVPPALAHAPGTLRVAWRNGQILRKLRLAAGLEV